MKTVSGIMLTLLLISTLTLAFGIQYAKAEPTTWTVDDDGGADFTRIQDAIYVASPGDTIYVYNGTYYERISIYKPLTLIGENKYATIIDGSGWTYEVIRIYRTNSVNITGFTIRNGGYGILVKYSINNKFFGNIVSNVGVRGIAIEEESWGNVINGNTVSDITGSPGPPYVTGRVAIWLSNYHNLVEENVVSKSEVGIYLEDRPPGWSAYNNTVVGNTISDLSENGVAIVARGYNNDIIANIISNIRNVGISLDSPFGYPNRCRNNFISDNVVSDSTLGITLGMASPSNRITGNNISNNGQGIMVSYHSDNNTIIENLVSNNYDGILLFSSDNTKVYHNNFIDNTQQVVLFQSFNTDWDDGYPSGGNYWSDYSTRYPSVGDDYQGENQDILGSDGIWDHLYEIDIDNIDDYPLVEPWSPKPSDPLEALEELIHIVESWNLDTGIETSLTSKLQASYRSFDRGNLESSIGQLTAFINEVEALIDRKLTFKQAEDLISEAQRIISLIEG